MKVNNIFKYIFIIFVLGILVYAGYSIYQNNKKIETEEEANKSQEEAIIKDLRMGITNFDTLNPLITSNREIINLDTLIFEPLFLLNSNYKLEACLATECSKTENNTYIVKINNSIYWHDGNPVTANDVQFTIDRLKDGNSVYKSNVSNVTSVEVVDESTVKITLDSDIKFFEYNLTFPILPSAYYANENFYTTSKVPIGTGRYKITNISTNSITLSKNDKWKKISTENCKIDTIKINIYSSMGEVFNSFKLGNIDILNTTNKNYSDYIGTLGYNITEYPGRQFDFLSINCQDEIFQDKEVRKAISYAIDKDNIVSTVYNNQYLAAMYPLDYGNYLYNDKNISSGYNVEQAKKVLEDDEWVYSNNVWTKRINGTTQRLKFKISVCKDDSTRVSMAEMIKAQLESIGIEVNVTPITLNQYNDSLKNKNYQTIITGIYNSYSPDLSYFFAEGNLENYYSEDMLSIINNIDLVKDSSTLIGKYEKIYDIYKEDIPFIGLSRSKNITISTQSLVGDLSPNNYSTFYNFNNWYRK